MSGAWHERVVKGLKANDVRLVTYIPDPEFSGSDSFTYKAKDAEAGGGLMVAVIQLAITLGATIGGLVLDAQGPVAAFASSAAILAVAAGVAWFGAEHAK